MTHPGWPPGAQKGSVRGHMGRLTEHTQGKGPGTHISLGVHVAIQGFLNVKILYNGNDFALVSQS